jgi:hypothetical protein
MADVNQYRISIETLLKQYAALGNSTTGIETQLIFDRERDHYLLSYVGWQQEQYICGPALQFDIKNGKVWFQYNATELEVIDELISLGVAEQDIIIGFYPPYLRTNE